VPFSTVGNYLAKWDGTAHRPIFIKGMNLGAAVPGTMAGELAITAEQYRRWLNRMGEMGVNSLRIYTLHYPRFYEEFARYNTEHPDRPIYLFQGVWLDEDHPVKDLDLYNLTSQLDGSIEDDVDCVYGNRNIAERKGRAYGRYTVDISRWVIGWIIGREIYQDEVMATNAAHPNDTSFNGTAVKLATGTPTETWATARVDKLINYERGRYGRQRPVSFSNWPTLDPLKHPSEGTYRREDIEKIDLGDLDTSNAPGGYFASYHAYPYYPDFMNEDPGYMGVYDDEGPNNYYGYIRDLKNHYSRIPLLIGEFGVPSSWGNAHYSISGMHHGGHDEAGQGRYNARMLRNMYDTGCAGGILFAWMDEWWKRSWITDPIAFPRDRYPLWHNMTGPEANFGLLSFDGAPPDFNSWGITDGFGRIKTIRAAYDQSYFYLEVNLDRAPVDGELLTIGYDTYRPDLGESILPGGLTVTNRAEFSVVIDPKGDSQLYVTQAYDLFGIWHWRSSDLQLYHSIPTDGAPWDRVRWMNNDDHHSDEYNYVFPDTIQEIGRLQLTRTGGTASSHDAVFMEGSRVTVRIPWTLLNFTDPNDDRDNTPFERETAVSDGIAVTVFNGGDMLETGRYVWPAWNVPPKTIEREKDSLLIYSQELMSLPDYLDR
jgi:hypothetical protein